MPRPLAPDELREALLQRLALLAASARRAGMGVSIEQLATLVRALGAVSQDAPAPIGRDGLKRLVGLTLGTCIDDLAVLGLLVDAFFPAPGPDAGPPGQDRQGELRARLQDAVRRGDPGSGAEIGAIIGALAGEWHAAFGSGRLEQRVLRALDLSAMLAQALSGSLESDPLQRQLARIAREATLASMEEALHSELLRRGALERARSGGTHSPVDLTGLIDETAALSIVGSRRADQERLQAAVRPLATRLAARARRRHRGGRRHLDIRRTIGRSIAAGGVPMELRFRRRRPRRPHIVVLADVSGSMVDYASFTMGLLQALHDELPALRCFAFVDGIGEVTHELLSRPAVLGAQLPMIQGVVSGDGRSDYGTALEAFAQCSPAVLTPTSSLVVIGDGCSRALDKGDDALRRISYQVRRLYWLTPEPADEWSRDDCHMDLYRRWCHRVDSVSTVGQLEAWVDAVIGAS